MLPNSKYRPHSGCSSFYKQQLSRRVIIRLATNAKMELLICQHIESGNHFQLTRHGSAHYDLQTIVERHHLNNPWRASCQSFQHRNKLELSASQTQ